MDIQYRGIQKAVPFKLPADNLNDARLQWKNEAIKAATAAIADMEKEATRLTLLNPNQGQPRPPFLKTRH